MRPVIKDFNFLAWYTPKKRLLSHVCFWAVIALFYFLNFRRLAHSHAWLFVLKDMLVVTTLFYFTIPLVVNQWLLKGKYQYIALWFIIAYTWWAAATYSFCYINVTYFTDIANYWNNYLSFVMNNGFDGMFKLKNLDVYAFDFIFLVSLPIGPKVMKYLVEREHAKTKLERDNFELELKFLKSQITPHFLFNTLNNIYIMSKKGDIRAPETVLRLSDMMRYILYDSRSDTVALSSEISFIQDFVALNRLRYDASYRIECNIPEIAKPYKISPLVLIPFVENAFKHGPELSQVNEWIHIDLRMTGNTLELIVENAATPALHIEKAGGVGLENVKRRLQLHYPDKHQLNFEVRERSFHVYLAIALK